MVVEPDFSRFLRVIAERLQVDERRLVPEASLREDLRVNAAALADLITALEDEFGREAPDRLTRNVRSVGELWRVFERRSKSMR